MASNSRAKLSAAGCLALDIAAATKSEFYCGEMFAMGGASRNHARLEADLAREVGNALAGGPCEHFSASLRVKAPATELYTYPDLSILCADPAFEDDVFDTLLNPT